MPKRSLAVLLLAMIGLPGSGMPALAREAGANELPAWTVQQPRHDRYLAAHGLRAFAGGYSEDGLEVWSFPLQIVSGYALEFVRGDGRVVRGIDVLDSARVDPLGFVRGYHGEGFHVSERIETRGMLPGVRVRLRVEGDPKLRVRARFEPSLNLMWPAGIGGQEFGWDASAHGLLFKEPSRHFAALVASPEAAAHSEPNNDRRGSTFGRPLFLEMDPTACGNARCATLVFAGQSETGEEVHATASALLAAPDAPLASDVVRFDDALHMRITTPDADANRALRWAQVALEQAWSCNARLGCGAVAGYGPSHGARRPQYAWYFAGDGLVATRALVQEGDFERASEELAFILRYQDPDSGMLWHELSQSAGFLHWTRDYPFMYVHVDIAFDFLPVLAGYVRASGDEALLRKHWPQVEAAWRYCLSTIDAGDGLPRVPGDKMSANEQDRLTDELTLSASWVEAADAMASMARSMGDPALASQAEADRDRARASVRARYRDNMHRRWISGFRRDGGPGESFSGADLAAIGSGAATRAEAAATFDRLASPDYLTGWGLRSKPSSAPDFDPEAYSRGSVWGLGTATAAEQMWRAGRAAQANALWLRLVPWAGQDAPGHMHEVESGERFVPQRESVPEQTWSSAAFLSAAIRGMLGLEVDASSHRLVFAPQPPATWQKLSVQGVRVGDSLVDLAWRREGAAAVLEVDNHGAPVELDWRQAGADAASPSTRMVPSGRSRWELPIH
ncbi:hypothetical protein ATSB10_04200 [Dyella thiooxydans]|uniref:Mannosylglycerate hydrolase MGH1-like glycoside hydrolase domain-containing protein n=1 Tax=Dyella thiooxydans TaxID=445710 RepID=A0A160MXX3_9GAMM|nr:hypothetical protein [Dyella thiooxydans]AND67874.1 hypothetical protein ATSB10_04200 [Dyella thiooxydans]